MFVIVLDTLLGLGGGIGGAAFAVLYFQSLQNGNNLFFLVLAIVLIIVGIKLLFGVTKKIENMSRIPDPLANINKQPHQNLVDKNNQIITDWKKTNENEARLKMLQLKAESEDESPTA